MALPEGRLIYNVHGLDGEGWRTFRSEYLIRTLERLVALPDLEILSAREILALAKQRTLFVLYD